MHARIYLRQNLFSLPGDQGHVPGGAAILVGKITETNALGVVVRVESFLDDRGRALQGARRTLLVPVGKIDHVWFED
jgi:hypothetical protein